MALTPTLHTFAIQLSDVDRNVYESLDIRAARHPSETAEYFLTRVLAYCFEYAEGIRFSPGGVSSTDEPPISIRDARGDWLAWIDVGRPDAARLHRASKLAPRVAVYAHQGAAALVRQLAGERIHRSEELVIHDVDRGLLSELVAHLERRMSLDLAITDGHVYATLDGKTFEGTIAPHRLGGG